MKEIAAREAELLTRPGFIIVERSNHLQVSLKSVDCNPQVSWTMTMVCNRERQPSAGFFGGPTRLPLRAHARLVLSAKRVARMQDRQICDEEDTMANRVISNREKHFQCDVPFWEGLSQGRIWVQ